MGGREGRGFVKIYTKKGDAGQTGLFGGGELPKDDLRIAAYGTVDELNAVAGLAQVQSEIPKVSSALREVQKQLFVLGAELATLKPSDSMLKGFIQDQHVSQLEGQIDRWEETLSPLKNFILPGGGKTAASLHLARTVCRRAERQMVTLHRRQPLRPVLLKYINRLSDWFFVLSRIANHLEHKPDILWEGIL